MDQYKSRVFYCRSEQYTVGVGLTTVLLHVVDIRHETPRSVNNYTLNIYRPPEDEPSEEFNSDKTYTVCGLKQVRQGENNI